MYQAYMSARAPLCSTVMPLRSVPLASLLAAIVAFALGIGVASLDAATDTSGLTEDAAARGAVTVPLIFVLLFAIYFATGRALVASGAPTFARAILFTCLAAALLVTIPACISIIYGGESLLALSTYAPWVAGVVALLALLVPGSILQAWLLRPRHNTLFERTREG